MFVHCCDHRRVPILFLLFYLMFLTVFICFSFQNAQCNYVQELSIGRVDPNTQFRYAYCLVHSASKSDITKGLELLQGI
jgi:hypothetical protein